MVIANPVAGFCVETVLGQLTAGETAAQGSVSGDVIGAHQAVSRERGNIADLGIFFSHPFFRFLNFLIFVLGD
jgi:hypothetical protein